MLALKRIGVANRSLNPDTIERPTQLNNLYDTDIDIDMRMQVGRNDTSWSMALRCR